MVESPSLKSFAEATAVQQVDSHTYSAYFSDDWCIGTVPHGGFVTSVFMQTASKHFATTLKAQDQPHTIYLQEDFLRRTQVGPATLVVKDVKVGRQTSVIHVTLIQYGREEIVAYITNSNIHTETGLSLNTEYRLHPPEMPVDMSKLRDNKDSNWRMDDGPMPFADFRKAGTKVRYYFPTKGQQHRSIADEWITFSTGERFMNESLGYVCDMWPSIIESYRADNPSLMENAGPPSLQFKGRAAYWYPTLVLSLDIKKALPEDGIEFLFVRVRTKQVKNGRLDLEVIVKDEDGDIVALSHQVALILPASRNIAERRTRKL